MEKMVIALSAIGLMIVANVLMIRSRKMTNKLWRVIVAILAAICLLGAFFFMLAVLVSF